MRFDSSDSGFNGVPKRCLGKSACRCAASRGCGILIGGMAAVVVLFADLGRNSCVILSRVQP